MTRDSGVSCVARTCPCDPEAPGLCEVELRNVTRCDGRPTCVVALAAAQEAHCAPGEQLLVSPAGWGECGCLAEPAHVRWPADQACYQVHTRGPCPRGELTRTQLRSNSIILLKEITCFSLRICYSNGRDR